MQPLPGGTYRFWTDPVHTGRRRDHLRATARPSHGQSFHVAADDVRDQHVDLVSNGAVLLGAFNSLVGGETR